MILKRYDVSLALLRHEDIEEVRHWRNTDKIKSRMQFREYITPEMQEKWFREISNFRKYIYFIVEADGKHVGLMHVKDFADNNTEAGMFIWDDEYISTTIPVIASLILADWNLFFLGNTHAVCRMLKSNKQAIDYNVNFGFKLGKGQDNVENQLYEATLEDHLDKTQVIRTRLGKIYKKRDDRIMVGFDDEDDKSGLTAFMTDRYDKSDKINTPVQFYLTHL